MAEVAIEESKAEVELKDLNEASSASNSNL